MKREGIHVDVVQRSNKRKVLTMASASMTEKTLFGVWQSTGAAGEARKRRPPAVSHMCDGQTVDDDDQRKCGSSKKRTVFCVARKNNEIVASHILYSSRIGVHSLRHARFRRLMKKQSYHTFKSLFVFKNICCKWHD
jgi:hypothetical protein